MSSYQELIAQREALDRQIDAARQAEQSKAIETVKSLIKQFQLSADDCGFKQSNPVFCILNILWCGVCC